MSSAVPGVMQSGSNWYQPNKSKAGRNLAQEAYEDGVEIFKHSLSNDVQKHFIASQTTTITDIYQLVADAQKTYSDSRRNQRVRKWLSKFSSRIQYYGNILDVLVQHHPEYVSLAWGAMKFLFVGMTNHENMIASLVKGLCQIGEALPRVQLASILYPTDQMKEAVAILYANVIRFLIRAQQWYQESKLRHLVHAITRPPEIRNTDLIEAVQSSTERVESLAVSGSQAELRDLHLELQQMMRRQETDSSLLTEIKQLIISNQTVNSSAHLDTSIRLSDLQRSQILSFLTTSTVHNADKSLQRSVQLLNWRRRKPHTTIDPFWNNHSLNNWNITPDSALIMIQSPFRQASEVQDIFVAAIQQLQAAQVPVLWILKTPDKDSTAEMSTIDIIKSLVLQALRLNTSLHTEKQSSLACTQFQTASTEEDWFALLGSVLVSIPRVYIVIDVDCLSSTAATTPSKTTLHSAFGGLFRQIVIRGGKTVVKVVLLTARPVRSSTLLLQDKCHFVSVSDKSDRMRRNVIPHRSRKLGAGRGVRGPGVRFSLVVA